jgi:hypothetical protein
MREPTRAQTRARPKRVMQTRLLATVFGTITVLIVALGDLSNWVP